jgi:hypothetical protein
MWWWNHNFLDTWVPLLAFLALAELILKGFALWRAARLNQSGWFIAILIINTAGILPLIYLLVTQKQAKAAK